MSVSTLTEVIEHGIPLVVLSPHLDDAVLSCGALMTYAVEHVPVTVATLLAKGRPSAIYVVSATSPAACRGDGR